MYISLTLLHASYVQRGGGPMILGIAQPNNSNTSGGVKGCRGFIKLEALENAFGKCSRTTRTESNIDLKR